MARVGARVVAIERPAEDILQIEFHVEGDFAFEAGQSDEALEAEAQKLEAYRLALDAEQGATMIAGVMSDRATDRHARVLLRRETAIGRFEAKRAPTASHCGLQRSAWAQAPCRPSSRWSSGSTPYDA